MAVPAALLVCASGAGNGRADTVTAADVAVTISGPSDGQVGDVLPYTITLVNHGPDAAVGELDFDAPGVALRYLGADRACADLSDTVNVRKSCPVQSLVAGSSMAVNVQFEVVGRTSTTFQARFKAVNGPGDPNPADDTTQIQVFPPADISSTAPPTLSGSATVGSTLTTSAGSWAPLWPYAYSYHWIRCAPAPGSCQTLSGSAEYPVTAADAGCTLQSVVTASSSAGSFNAGSAPSAQVPGGPCNTNPLPPPPQALSVNWADSLPHATQFQQYRTRAVLAGPQGMYVGGGPMPNGLTISSDGEISGVPTFADNFTFTVSVFASGKSVARDFTLVVDPPAATNQPAGSAIYTADPELTPGVRNRNVRASTIKATICSTRWLTRQQPTASYLLKLKVRQMHQYQEPGPSGRYQEDQLIPIGLGGAAKNPSNLWPEPIAKARLRNNLEQQLNRLVCDGKLTLVRAQRQIVQLKRTTG
jgi:hypothetical protein